MKVRNAALARATLLTLTLAACGDDTNNAMNGNDAAVTSDGGSLDAANSDASNADGATGDAEVADANVASDLGPDATVDPTPDEVTFSEIPEAFAAAWCARPECFAAPDFESMIAALYSVTPGGPTCEVRVANYLTLSLGGISEPPTWDGVAAKACFDFLRTEGTCDDLFRTSCLPDLEGDEPIGEGGVCTNSYACGEGLACDKGGVTDYRCEGTCETGTPLGGSCTNGDECARISRYDSIFCSPPPGSFSGAICIRDRYTNEAGVGDDCDVSTYDEATFTRTNVNCANGLRCRDNVCVEEARGTLGDACSNDGGEGAECERRYECLAAEGGGSTCQYLPIATTAGATCGLVDDAPVLCDLFAGFACAFASEEDESGTCVAIGDGSLGSTCMLIDSFAKSSTCDGDLRCAVIGDDDFIPAGTCAARLANEELCNSSDDCVSGYCQYLGCGEGGCENRCAERRAIEDGGSCVNDDDCMSGSCQSICGVAGCDNICTALECGGDA